ncbi:MAG: ABC transporter permease [Candidatus Latescibacteria bacterium]|nr:ABC transporter permease [Candidatus Latescibacterota bacterium]
MSNTYEYFIARRLMRAMRRQHQVSFTAAIAIAGVTIGVAALVIVLSVFNGFSALLWDSLLSISPHVVVQKPHAQPMSPNREQIEELEKLDSVRAAAPFIAAEGFALRRPPGGEIIQAGVAVRGIGLAKITDMNAYLWAGDLDLNIQPPDPDQTTPAARRAKVYGTAIGRVLADRIGAVVGTEIMLGLVPKEVLMGQQPQLWPYRVTAIFHTGLEELDSALAFVSLEAAQRDLGWRDQISGIQIRLAEPFEAHRIASTLPIGTDFDVVTWMDTHRNLYASIRLEKWFSSLVLCLIVMVAGFNIISILTMTVGDRQRDIGILKAMGATPRSIGKIFTLKGLGVGLTGVVFGNAIGYILCWSQQTFEWIKLPGQIYIIQALPVKMLAIDFVCISLASVGLCFIFALLPARKAASLAPIVALRE